MPKLSSRLPLAALKGALCMLLALRLCHKLDCQAANPCTMIRGHDGWCVLVDGQAAMIASNRVTLKEERL